MFNSTTTNLNVSIINKLFSIQSKLSLCYMATNHLASCDSERTGGVM